ncbi:MAG TPA: aspartate aminotransferase family protein [Bryobacteraceae bacterium]|jgi:4-aminobutyrate---pyruvate transaminase|nr:aspartate aminotransferase family protein [Bryobacteraceae bacterium]
MSKTTSASRDIATTIHPYTNLKLHESEGPLVITEGDGVFVRGEDGKMYLEGLAGLWCVSLGFSERRLAEAAYRQMLKLPFYHTFAHKATDIGIELAEKLLSIAPAPMSKAFFVNSGSEANDTVVKLVWYYNNALGRPRKKKIISRTKAYHGVTVASASLTGLANNHRDFDLPIANILHVDCPHYYRFGLPGETEEAFASRMAESLENRILSEGPETVAAFIGEPIMGAGGVLLPPATYWDKIQAVLRKYDVLLIADEVICAFGRTGEMWGTTTFGLKPDMITCAKALSSGYLPIGAVLVSEAINGALVKQSEKIGVFSHGFTYSGHPVASAVALETLKIYEQDDILSQVRRVAPRMQAGLRRFADHPLVGEVRGIGLIGAIELVRDKATKTPFDPAEAVGPFLSKRAHHHGVILRPLGDSIAFCPPLIIKESEIDLMLERFALALDDTFAMVRDRGLVASGLVPALAK